MPDRAHCTIGLFLWSNQMTQRELNREIANQTGDSIQTINTMGFGPLRSVIPIEERQEPLIIDWDEVDRIRQLGGAFWAHATNLTLFTFTSFWSSQLLLRSRLDHGAYSYLSSQSCWESQSLTALFVQILTY